MTAADSSLLLADVVRALQGLYPPATAMDWDRVGLVTGDLSQPVSRVHLAVDPTLGVVEEAVAAGANLLVTHHPLLLRGVSSVATVSAKGEAVTRAILGDLAIYCAHTNADVATPGVSDALAEACGLQSVEPLQGGPAPLGRIGTLPEPQTLQAFVERLAQALPATAGGIRVSGSPEEEVSRVAVVGGAGDDQFDAVRSAGADAYVTADLRHHPVLEEREQARGGRPFLVDAGHWASEWVWLASVERELTRVLDGAGQPGASTRLDTYISTLRTEPWTFVLGANAVGGTS
jgi:dinuclear metal center YbgI/SA1388 family protein